jgi:hypothetical protein
LLRLGANSWSVAAGSQGLSIVNPLGVDETVHRLGQLYCDGWIARNMTRPEQYGFGTNNLQLVIELKSGEKLALDFGAQIPQKQTVIAAVTLEGERWAFEFPPALLALVAQYLTIPAPSQ